jgi:soluble lytic murein transglycosylase-like protein
MRLRVILPFVVAAMLIAPAAASAYFSHVVAPGESLSSIAAADGLTVGELAAANGVSSSSSLIAGRAVQIPPRTGGLASTSSVVPTTTTAIGDGDGDGDDVGGSVTTGTSVPVSTGSAAGSYVVQPGDTLSAIAARAGVSVASLAAANGLDLNGVLVAGSALRLSGSASTVYVSTSSAPAVSQPVGAAAQGSVADPPYPTPERLSASQIGQVAAANGVSPSLAAAVAWQESGFNNNLVSSADARGIMQILPGTWQYIENSLNAGTPLAPASAFDNVRGGALLLRSLLNSTGGNSSLAAAGYYQGLPSVQRYGVYPETQRYVNSVMALRQQFGGG